MLQVREIAQLALPVHTDPTGCVDLFIVFILYISIVLSVCFFMGGGGGGCTWGCYH